MGTSLLPSASSLFHVRYTITNLVRGSLEAFGVVCREIILHNRCPRLSLLCRTSSRTHHRRINQPRHGFTTMPANADPAREPLLGSSSTQITYTDNGSDNHKRDNIRPAKIVHFFADDPEDPRNWPRWKKWLMIGPILLIDLSVSWGASGLSPASSKFAQEFGLPAGLGTLGLSSYVLGLAFGPMTLAPLSEVRRSEHKCLASFSCV